MESTNEMHVTTKGLLGSPIILVLFFLSIIFMAYFLSRRVADLKYDHLQLNKSGRESIDIDPLSNHDYASVPGKTYRPFKPTFHLTMDLEVPNLYQVQWLILEWLFGDYRNEWIEIDCNYRTQIADRARIVQTYSSQVLGITTNAKALVTELFSEIILHHLPQRFPSIFSLSADSSTFSNSITGQSFPSQPIFDEVDNGSSSLRVLAVSIVEDLFILRPDASTGKYHLCAFVGCYPNGFQTQKLLGKSVSEIHTPVPLYKEKLEISVDRFFEHLKEGVFMRRFNWSLTTCGHELFTPKGLNSYAGSTDADDENVELDIQDVYLRVERQIMTRLPRSKAVIFTVKTFMTPLTEVRHEGTGPQLLAAVKAWPEKVAFYKRRPYWFNKVCKYLENSNKNECS